MRLLNRWTSGLIQSGTQNFSVSSDNKFESTRTINARGLTGVGVVVTLLDSGVDIDNPFFDDPTVPFITDQYNFAHRKIVRYDAAVDSTDKINGHGTRAGGTIAGCAVCGEALNLYRGDAHGSKLYVVDMAEDTATDKLNVSAVFDALEVAKRLGSVIVSYSWGASEEDSLFRFVFDYLTVQHQILFVFAAGNDGLPYSISTPGNAKNVLTVRAATPAKGSFTSDLESAEYFDRLR
jgi:subtilisin family serine protease